MLLKLLKFVSRYIKDIKNNVASLFFILPLIFDELPVIKIELIFFI